MKLFPSVVFGFVCAVIGDTDSSSPTSTVIELISDLQQKIIAEGEVAQKTYNEFASYCKKRAVVLGSELKEDKKEEKGLEAEIQKEITDIKTEDMRAEEESEDIAEADADLKSATKIREKEAADFAVEEKELVEVVSMLKRAAAVIQEGLQKGSSSMLQLTSTSSLMEVLGSMVKAALCSSEDAARITALAQTGEDSDDSDSSSSSSTALEPKSQGIVDTLLELLDKAQKQLEEIRRKETEAKNNFALMKQNLKTEVQVSKEDMDDAKKEEEESQEEKSELKGDETIAEKDIKQERETLSDLRRVCVEKVQEFTATHNSRADELKALAEAKKVIQETTGAATQSVYGDSIAQVSMRVQVSSHAKALSGELSANSNKALMTIRNLGKKHHSQELLLLASRMASTFKTGSYTGEDPFAKVVGMISDMINKLEKEAADDANQEAYCDKELAEAKAKKAEREKSLKKSATAIDQKSARSAKLKEQVAKVQESLAQIQSAQVEMDKLRKKETDEYLTEKNELEQGIKGVQTALNVLQEYYGKADKAHSASDTAGNNIIGLLQTIESDFSKSLAEMNGSEENAQANYESQTKENELGITSKEVEVKQKTKEFVSLDKAITDVQNDRASVQDEQQAVAEVLTTLNAQCVKKPEEYLKQKESREEEIAGLKQALAILEDETAFFQLSSKRALRGPLRHRHA